MKLILHSKSTIGKKNVIFEVTRNNVLYDEDTKSQDVITLLQL